MILEQAKKLSVGMDIDYQAVATENIDFPDETLKYSPDWSGAGETIHPIAIPDCYKEKFDIVYHGEYPSLCCNGRIEKIGYLN